MRRTNLPKFKKDSDGIVQIVQAKPTKRSELCKALGCRHVLPYGEKFCSRCKSARWRARNPLRCRYKWIRERASKRGISFSLTFKQFKQIANGVNIEDMHLDRVDPSKGYKLRNVQWLTQFDNLSKATVNKMKHQEFIPF